MASPIIQILFFNSNINQVEIGRDHYFHIRKELNFTLCDLKNFSTAFFLEKGTMIQPLASFSPFDYDNEKGAKIQDFRYDKERRGR